MLLTLPWSVALWLARCDIRHGESIDNTLTRPYGTVLPSPAFSLHTHTTFSSPITDFKNTGATMDDDIPLNAKIMMGTSISYFIVQGVAFAYLTDPDGAAAEKIEDKFALAGFIICACLLVAYSAFQVLNPKLQEKKITEARKSVILKPFFTPPFLFFK
jgi:hypothetical protein